MEGVITALSASGTLRFVIFMKTLNVSQRKSRKISSAGSHRGVSVLVVSILSLSRKNHCDLCHLSFLVWVQ